MDFTTALVDLLRRGKDREATEGLYDSSQDAPADPDASGVKDASRGLMSLTHPGYAAYVREAEASGEPVMSPDEFAKFQAGN